MIMNKMLKILLIGGLATQVFAAKTLAVLEIIPSREDIPLELSEYRHLTDELRARAREALPQTGFSILTRDNIISLLPPDSEEAECLADACAVEIGRAIGAEYITQGFVGKFGDMLTLTVELYESMSGNLLGSFVTESKDVMGLLATIRQKSPELFSKLSPKKSSTAKATKEKPEASLATDGTSNTSFYVALGLDALGAIMLGYGIYQHSNANSLYDDYKKLPVDDQNALKKANDAKQMRNVGLSLGAVFLAAGIGVHIWF